jgi:hypothetical protein
MSAMDPDDSASKGEPERSRPSPIISVVVIVVLTVGGWFLVQHLIAASRLQDCQMQGRHNCVAPDE